MARNSSGKSSRDQSSFFTMYFIMMTLAAKHFGESESIPQKRHTNELFESDKRKDPGNFISGFKLMNFFILSMFSAQSIHCVVRLGVRMDWSVVWIHIRLVFYAVAIQMGN